MISNHPPTVPFNPFPEDGYRCEGHEITLSWDCYDEDGDSLTYDFYFVFKEAGEEDWIIFRTLRKAEFRLIFGWRSSGNCGWRVSVSDGHHYILGPWWAFRKVW